MSPHGNFPSSFPLYKWEEMLRSMNISYLPRRLVVCGICILALLIALAGCGGSSAPTTNAPSSAGTNTATVGITATGTTPSPTSTQPGVTPTQAKPSPTPTKAKPTPTATRTTPTPTPTRSTPTPKPSPSPTPAPTTMTVTIVSTGGFGFSPQTLTIAVGTTIIWKNNTSAPHTVTSDSGVFDSGTIQPGATFSFKFTSAGTFAYHCSIHPYMTATITDRKSVV